VSSRDEVELRPITSGDRAALVRFNCRGYGEPWTEVIEEMVNHHLADALETNGLTALGLWRDGNLCAVAAWRLDVPSRICRVALLAVQSGNRRKGLGRRLKEEVLGRARQSGAIAVVSVVHWDNDPMIELNVQLGANIEQIDDDTDHCLCVIPLQRSYAE
jgi:GNAT superfamily N-acetyltransferase